MMRLLLALLVSVCVHSLLAAALAVYLRSVPPTELPRLDLSAVELSFAEEEASAADPATPQLTEPEPEPEPPEPEPEPEPEPPEPEPEPPEPEPEPVPELEPEPPELPDPPVFPDTTEPEPPSSEPEPPLSEPPPPSPVPAPLQARIDAPPSAVKPIRPAYPTGARLRNEEGDVVLELDIGAHGRVTRADVFASCGYPELDAAALRAAKKARFVPARSGRDAVAATVRVTIEFRLSRR